MQVDIIVPVAFFATVFGVIYIVISARNKERLALIDKGLDVSIFKSKSDTHGRYDALKFGLLLIGLAIGLLMGNLLDSYTQVQEEVAYFSMVLLFGGISLILFYTIMKRLKQE